MPGVECLQPLEVSKARHLSPHTMDCPECHGTSSKVIETKVLTNGTRRRRYRCLACEHRWTEWTGERPPRGGVGTTHRRGKRKGRLTTAQIRLVLTRRDLNNRQVGELIGCSYECVRQIRAGIIYGHVLPDLIRPNAKDQRLAADGPSCLKCAEFPNGECSYGFPDPLEEGLTFAADCELYAPVSQSISRACPSSVQ